MHLRATHMVLQAQTSHRHPRLYDIQRNLAIEDGLIKVRNNVGEALMRPERRRQRRVKPGAQLNIGRPIARPHIPDRVIRLDVLGIDRGSPAGHACPSS